MQQGKIMSVAYRVQYVAAAFLTALVAGPVPRAQAAVNVPCDPAALVTAVANANTAAGPDVLNLAAGCTYSLKTPNNYWYGPNGLPAISSDITIEGNGAVIERSAVQGTPPFRLFFVGADPTDPDTLNYVSPGAGKLTLKSLTLRGGHAKGEDGEAGGGGAGMGGAIFSQGQVSLDRVTATNNHAQGGNI
jgi:hypothetical protein